VAEEVQADFACDPASVTSARAFVAETAMAWGLGAVAQTAALVTSELATNAVQHARTPFRVSVQHRPPDLLVEVFDGSERHPPRPHPSAAPEGATGRGLVVVGRLADRWGTRPEAGGKAVWFTIGSAVATPRAPSHIGGHRRGGGRLGRRCRHRTSDGRRSPGFEAPLDWRLSALCATGLHDACTHWNGEQVRRFTTKARRSVELLCGCACHANCPTTVAARRGRVPKGVWAPTCSCPRAVALREAADQP